MSKNVVRAKCAWCARPIVVDRVAHRNILPDGRVELWHRSCWEGEGTMTPRPKCQVCGLHIVLARNIVAGWAHLATTAGKDAEANHPARPLRDFHIPAIDPRGMTGVATEVKVRKGK